MKQVAIKEKSIPSILNRFKDLEWDDDWPFFQNSMFRHAERVPPAIDVHETEDEYLVSAELPGLKKEDIKVSIQNGVLTINAESKFEAKKEKKGRIIRQERQYGNIVRSLSLGSVVKEESIKADYKNGVLSLRIPKKEEAKPKVIDVKVN